MITAENIRRDLIQYSETNNVTNVRDIYNKYLQGDCEIDSCHITNNFCQLCYQQSFLASAISNSNHVYMYLNTLLGTNDNFSISPNKCLFLLKKDISPEIIKTTVYTLHKYCKLDKKEIYEFIDDNEEIKKNGDLIIEFLDIHLLKEKLDKEIIVNNNIIDININKQKYKI